MTVINTAEQLENSSHRRIKDSIETRKIMRTIITMKMSRKLSPSHSKTEFNYNFKDHQNHKHLQNHEIMFPLFLIFEMCPRG